MTCYDSNVYHMQSDCFQDVTFPSHTSDSVPCTHLPCHYSLSIRPNIQQYLHNLWLKSHVQHSVSFIQHCKRTDNSYHENMRYLTWLRRPSPLVIRKKDLASLSKHYAKHKRVTKPFSRKRRHQAYISSPRNVILSTLTTPALMRSFSLPGVAIIICTPSSTEWICSDRLPPPYTQQLQHNVNRVNLFRPNSTTIDTAATT